MKDWSLTFETIIQTIFKKKNAANATLGNNKVLREALDKIL